MGRRQLDSGGIRFAPLALVMIAIVSCGMIFISKFSINKRFFTPTSFDSGRISDEDGVVEDVVVVVRENECCKGTEHLELWGDAVKWGSEFKVKSSEECCLACKDKCRSEDGHGPCLCDSWVFCGDKDACGPRYGECWLKKQKDTLVPDVRESGEQVMWTSGLIFGKNEGIVLLETEYGALRVKLLPDLAPRSVAYILELLTTRHCAGCHFYRAESRGSLWDSEGNHIQHASFGPPFALLQGTLESHGTTFKEIVPTEVCHPIKKGSVAWVGSGPEFFISLANHHEWKSEYTVFGYVLPEDMENVEKISRLPTKPEMWSNINVSLLEKHVSLRIRKP